MPFWICNDKSEWSSFDKSGASRDNKAHHQIRVTCRRFSAVLSEFGVPYYLKIDIEGNEIFSLRELTATDLPTYVSFENTTKAEESLSIVRDLGYSAFKLISQHNFLPVEYPGSFEQRRYEWAPRLLNSKNIFLQTARRLGLTRWLQRLATCNRIRHNWTFPPGSSRPFGEDLPGRGQSFEEIGTTFERADTARSRHEARPFWHKWDHSFWADFHAKRKAEPNTSGRWPQRSFFVSPPPTAQPLLLRRSLGT